MRTSTNASTWQAGFIRQPRDSLKTAVSRRSCTATKYSNQPTQQPTAADSCEWSEQEQGAQRRMLPQVRDEEIVGSNPATQTSENAPSSRFEDGAVEGQMGAAGR